ncbi:MAG: PEP-CTERM sorting domain-containing protein [Sedimentisphaerales bacterium]|nr:PEP-CTERM sorting domain-containing protein [Sedimentisphaerales bacterium]
MTTLDFPGAEETSAHGIDGGKIVGSYWDSDWNGHGFLYDGSTWMTLDFPDAEWTIAGDIDGDSIVGIYRDSDRNVHGFLYDGSTWMTLDFPDAEWTRAYGIDGAKIVGSYEDASGTHGFIYTIPEPATLLLLGLGGIGLLRRRRGSCRRCNGSVSGGF